MKARIQGKLAMAAGAAAILASAGIALADGMPGGPGSYDRPGSWNGAYVGLESGWDYERLTTPGTSENRNAVTYGIFLGYQHQFGPLVLGVEADLIGNQADQPGTTTCGKDNCSQHISDMFTIGPRIGWAAGRWMPYVTGGFASGSVDFRKDNATTGVAVEIADKRLDGWYAGGGLDWKLSRHAVVGIEYRHVDLGSGTSEGFKPADGTAVGPVTQHAESDTVMLRGSLLFGVRDYAPLK
jgi:opacity protein-like surface antigen